MYSSQVLTIATSGGSSEITYWLTIIMAKFVSEAFEELKKQVESLGLDEKSKSKFLKEEWCKMCEAEAAAEERRLQVEREAAAEEKRAERETEEKKTEQEAEEKRDEHEAEERKLLAMREAEERKVAMELERLKLELEAKRLKIAAPPAGIAEEVMRRSARIARSLDLPAFVDGRDDLDNYLLRFERYATVAGWEKEA